MCGICGLISDKKIEKMQLQSMMEKLSHRGPDAEGLVIRKIDRGNYLGFGHKRLSIIDLSANANQPMTDKSGNIIITYNGEIYNFPELKEILISKGYSFKTNCDTEVLIYSYLEWGIDFIKKLNGMFAFALWDNKKERLILARDRLGIKPVYYFRSEKLFAFASELKSILTVKDIGTKIDPVSLNDYFSLQYIPSPRTILKNFFKLEPGSYLIVKKGLVKYTKYWTPLEIPKKKISDPEEIKEKLALVLNDSVKKRMISDVPLGAFLSGGVDSSIVVGIMAGLSTTPIKTFTIGFDTKSYKDELDLAKISSKHFGTEHHEDILSEDKLVDLLPDLVSQMDEPFADHSVVPTFLVSRLAREKVTVALSGDGGDENFGGYPRKYLFAKNYGRYERIPSLVRYAMEKSSAWFLSMLLRKNGLSDNKLERTIDILRSPAKEKVFSPFFILTKRKKEVIYSNDFINLLNGSFDISIFDRDQFSPSREKRLQWVMCHDLKNYLVDDILTKVDRMSMINSLEVRVPYLDYRIVELSLTIPPEMKIKKVTKWILRETFKKIVPSEVMNAKKKGFGIPPQIRFGNKLKNMANEVIFRQNSVLRDYFNLDNIRSMINSKKNYKEIWPVLVFALWEHRYLK